MLHDARHAPHAITSTRRKMAAWKRFPGKDEVIALVTDEKIILEVFYLNLIGNKTPARRSLRLLGLVYVKVRSTTYAYTVI